MQSLFEDIGGEPGVRRLVDRFYDIIEADPAAHDLLLLHLRGHGVAHSRIEQFNFLCGFLGGPQYYTRKFGHAHLRALHAHVPIGPAARDLWLACMEKAVAATVPEEAGARLMRHFTRVAEQIRNRD